VADANTSSSAARNFAAVSVREPNSSIDDADTPSRAAAKAEISASSSRTAREARRASSFWAMPE